MKLRPRLLMIACAAVLLFATVSHGSEKTLRDLLSDRLVDVNRCGAHCLQVCANLVSRPTTQAEIERYLPADGDPKDLKSLKEAAAALGLSTFSVRWTELPDELTAPAIVPTVLVNGRRHFIVLAARTDSHLLVTDFPRRPYWVSVPTFLDKYGWNGYALHIAASEADLVGLKWRVYRRPILFGGCAVIIGILALANLRRQRNRDQTPTERHESNPESTAAALT